MWHIEDISAIDIQAPPKRRDSLSYLLSALPGRNTPSGPILTLHFGDLREGIQLKPHQGELEDIQHVLRTYINFLVDCRAGMLGCAFVA